MAHSLAATLLSARPNTFVRVRGCHEAPMSQDDHKMMNRRSLSLGMGMVASAVGGSARAATRRPPPPPPTEKKDPNVSGVQAKVLASKRRKEAMKQEIAKLRLKGKSTTPPPPQETQQ